MACGTRSGSAMFRSTALQRSHPPEWKNAARQLLGGRMRKRHLRVPGCEPRKEMPRAPDDGVGANRARSMIPRLALVGAGLPHLGGVFGPHQDHNPLIPGLSPRVDVLVQ